MLIDHQLDACLFEGLVKVIDKCHFLFRYIKIIEEKMFMWCDKGGYMKIAFDSIRLTLAHQPLYDNCKKSSSDPETWLTRDIFCK